MSTIREKNAITEGNIVKQLLLFFFPILFGSLFQQLYNVTDAVILGQFAGKEALAAIDSTASMVRLLLNLFIGISTGATILISQEYGARRFDKVAAAVHTAIAFAAVGGAIMSVIGIALTPFGIRLMNVPEEIVDAAKDYVFIYFLGMIPSMIYNLGAAILRAVGDSKRPLYFLIAAMLTNIALDLLFVAVLKMGTAGAAIATVIAQAVSAALVLGALMRSKEAYRLELKRIRLELSVVKQILRIGLPVGIQSSMYPISNMIVQSTVNKLGTDMIAAWSLCGKLDFPIWMIMDALSICASTFVAQNYGARRMDRVFKSVRACLGLAHLIVIPLSAALFLFSEPLSYLFINDPAIAQLTGYLMRFYAPFFIAFIWGEVLAGTIRGTGETLRPMLMTLTGTCALRIAWILLIVPLKPTMVTIILCYPVTWVVTSVMFILYYLYYRKRKLMPALRMTQ